MGPSGSGKSTLMHILAGLDRPTERLGRDRRHAARRARRPRPHAAAPSQVGFIFQSYNLLPVLTAEENILLPLRIAGERADRDVARDADRRPSGSGTAATHRPSELSAASSSASPWRAR